jgi:hypothetical protein
MSSSQSPAARLVLAGHAPTPAQVQVRPRPRKQRMVRALTLLVVFWALVPLVFLIPPHLPWALGAFAAGIYFALRSLRGEYVVDAFSGACPRCGEPLKVAPGTLVKLPYTVTCYSCHHEPALQVDRSTLRVEAA